MIRIRSPRNRASNSKIAPPGSPDFLPLEECIFPPELWADINRTFVKKIPVEEAIRPHAELRSETKDPFLVALEDITAEHRRAVTQGISSVPEARASLLRLAKFATDVDKTPARRAKVQRILGSLNDRAHSLLLVTLRADKRLADVASITGWLNAHTELDWEIVRDAAAASVLLLPQGGPYEDSTLAITIERLVDMFEAMSGSDATYSLNRREKQSSAPKSAAARFISTCVKHIDPDVPYTTALTYLEQHLSSRDKRGKK